MGYEFRPATTPLASIAWRVEAESSGSYVDAANEFWGLAFGRYAETGAPYATLIGPSIEPRTLVVTEGDVACGIEFCAHVFLRGVPKLALLGELRDLPTDGRFFELAGIRFPVPDYAGVEALVEAMHAQGVLVADELIAAALAGEEVAYSDRQLRRRAKSTTGLNPKAVDQLRRARRAYQLLQQGCTLTEAAQEAGYSDQAHMTRGFVALAGLSPARLLDTAGDPFSSRPD